MTKYLKIMIPFIVGFFLLGLGWGAWTHQNQVRQLAHATPLRILCEQNWISDALLEKFSSVHNVRIQQWTYATPSEFIRQIANSDGKIDVICTSSLLVKSLVKSHWLKKLDFQSLANAKLIAVDFSHLPYDPESEYSVPLFWNLYGFFGKDLPTKPLTWKQTLNSQKISLWGEELNILDLMTSLGFNVEQRLQEEDTKSAKAFADELKHFNQAIVRIVMPEPTPLTADFALMHSDLVQLPLARVAHLLGEKSPYHFWLPEDGAMVELGVLSVGEKSTQPELALALINEVISSDEALATHERLGAGVLHASLNDRDAILPMQKPQALRQFPLNRLQFPDLNLEVLPRFQKIFDESLATRH